MEPGDEINGYHFESKIGEGGVAEVWRVTSATTADQLAVKVLLPHFSQNPGIRARFEREGHIQLVHPNIVPVLRLEEFEGRPGLVMPLYKGGSLEGKIRPTALEQEANVGKPLPFKDTFSISMEILEALNFANEKQIIHRDVKPDNILFDELGHSYLTDFGIALDMKRLRVTEAGGDLGTAVYGSPEQARNPRKVDHRTDVYSFGCCLYDMLAGRPPFLPEDTGGDTSFNLRLAHLNETPPPLRNFNPEVPDELNDLVMVALAKNPDDRFAGCADFATHLKAIAQQLSAGGTRNNGSLKLRDEIKGYLFERKIGQGGMAEVWQVKRVSSGEVLAAKVLLPEYCTNMKIRARFEREGQIHLEHPNIVPVLALEEFRGRPAMVMPLYRGGSLEGRIRKTPAEEKSGIGKPLPWDQTFTISMEILGALDYANQHEIIHRDVKPDNILFDDAGRAHMADFGIALDMKRVRVTEAGGDLGTAVYISPEQIRNPRTVDHRADLYSFGCCLYDMLTGRPPFLSDEVDDAAWSFDLRLRHVKEQPQPVRQFNAAVSPELDDLVLRCLAKEPDQRPAGCGDMARRLAALQAHKGTGRDIAMWASRLRDLALAALAAGLIAGLTFAAGVAINDWRNVLAVRAIIPRDLTHQHKRNNVTNNTTKDTKQNSHKKTILIPGKSGGAGGIAEGHRPRDTDFHAGSGDRENGGGSSGGIVIQDDSSAHRTTVRLLLVDEATGAGISGVCSNGATVIQVPLGGHSLYPTGNTVTLQCSAPGYTGKIYSIQVKAAFQEWPVRLSRQ